MIRRVPMLRAIGSALLLAILAGGARAEDLRVNAGFDREAAAPGEPVTYSITISADSLPGTRVLPSPDFRDFESVLGPSSGQSSEIRFVNGAMSKRENITFSWQVVPKKEGVATVPSCTFAVGSEEVTTRRSELRVDRSARSQPRRGASGLPPGFGGRRDPRRPWSEPVRRVGEGMSVRTELSASEVFVGQPIVVKDILTFNSNVNSYKERLPPEFTGFAKKRNSGIKPEGRKVQDPSTGQVHSEAVIGQWVIIPLTPGRKELPGHAYSFFLPSADPMEAMMGAEVEVPRESAGFTVEVRPLPSGAPAGFGGAVGSFQISASLAANQLAAGDGTQLVIVVRGRGSFESVSAPELDLPEGLKAFPPEIDESVDFASDGTLEGRKSFTYPILATASGHHEIPPLAWAYFDPASIRYVELATKPLTLEAAGGAPDVQIAQGPAPVVPVLAGGSDIRHPHGSLPRWRPDASTGGMPSWFVGVAVAGPLLNILLAAWSLLGRLRESDPAVRRAQAAPGVARRRLAEASAALAAGKKVDAADAAARAIAGLLSDRLGLGAELAPPEAAAALTAAGEAELADRVARFLSGCDFVRFASGTAADAQRLLREAQDLVPPLARIEMRKPS